MKEPISPDADAETKVAMRSKGVQARSRERIEHLLSAAESLIAEAGIEGLVMRELARRASLPIASVYHYFPSSNSVIRALAIRHMEQLQQFLAEKLAFVEMGSQDDQMRAEIAGNMVREVAEFVLQAKGSAAIWDSLRASPELRILDMEDTAKNSRFLEPFVRWVVPGLDTARVYTVTYLLLESVMSMILLIMRTQETDRNHMVDAMAQTFAATFRGLQMIPSNTPKET